MAEKASRELGLALSGGGSRAAGFHRGTLAALHELALADRIDVISTVSGGSVFGAAWMAARSRGISDSAFASTMRDELGKGFIARSVRPALIKTLIPGCSYSRTHLIGETFDRAFFNGLTLKDLPERPALCVNTAILNNGQVGKFARDGFSAWGIRVPGPGVAHVVPWSDFPVSKAVAASAAFPIGLPPLVLPASDFPSGTEFQGTLAGAKALYLTDGGVLENLGVQTLLRSDRYATWNLIVSDAGAEDQPWQQRSLTNSLRGFGVWLAGGRTLDRIMIVMNSKQNRWTRQTVFDEMMRSWLASSSRSDAQDESAGLAHYLKSVPERQRRTILFARVAQDWRLFFASIPRWRLLELAESAGGKAMDTPSGDPGAVVAFLKGIGRDLTRAEEHYKELGGDEGARSVNAVATGFTALSKTVLDQLAAHAAWQVHAAYQVFGPIAFQ